MVPTCQSNSSNLNTQKAFLKIPGFTSYRANRPNSYSVSCIFTPSCSLKWVNELQHEILSQLIIHFILGITMKINKQRKICRKFKMDEIQLSSHEVLQKHTTFHEGRRNKIDGLIGIWELTKIQIKC